MRNLVNKILFLCLIFVAFGSINAQVTTATMTGEVADANFVPVANAQVVAVHEPTQARYTGVTNSQGFFQLNNIRVGGPYTVQIVADGFMDYEEGNLSAQLGQTTHVNVQLFEGVVLEGVVMQARTTDRDKTGAETTLDREMLQTLPNVTGGVADFVRITPQAKITDDNVISIAGQNNRYNAIYIDGGVDNDVFGLAASGLDGGQTGGNPFALHELDQITVSMAPYDVRQSGFAGGAINATTRGGSNEWSGSAYWLMRNQNLTGNTQEYDESRIRETPEFSANRYGASLGGPIWRDRVFFFATYEKEQIETPQPYNQSIYTGDALESGQINDFLSVLQNQYNYNPGGFGTSTNTLNKDIFATRLDFNISDIHQLSLKYKYTKFDQFNAAMSGTTALNFLDRSIVFPSTKNQFALDFNSAWSNNFNTKALLTYKTVRDHRQPNGMFPTMIIQDGAGTINLGAEQFSTANKLDQDVFSGIFSAEYQTGIHNIVGGIQFDYYDMMNIFIRNNYGVYYWNNNNQAGVTGLQSFLAGNGPNQFIRTFSLIEGDTFGANNQGAAAAFNAAQAGAFLQDQIRITNNFNITAGLRIDVPFYEQTRLNEDFNAEIPLFEAAGYDLRGARTGQAINSNVHFSPRLGFNATFNQRSDFRILLRGGVGVFTSRVPLVWIGGAYNNTGNTIGEINVIANANQPLTFNPDISSNNGFGLASSRPEVNLFDPNFKLPQRLKFNIGVDQRLPENWNLVADFQYDKVLNDVFYQNVNIRQVGVINGSGVRPRWLTAIADPNPISSSYGEVFLGTNTNEGYGYTFSMGVNKNFWRRLYLALNYTYNDAFSVNNGTSSQNSSQWNTTQTVSGKNIPELARSNYSMGSRVTTVASYTHNWNEGNPRVRTKIAAFYEGMSGSPFSFVYAEGRAANNRILFDDAAGRLNVLIYVPESISDINLSEGFRNQTVQEQWDALNNFIESNPYLRSRRGQFVERNGSRLPWTNVIDLRLQQEFDINVAGKTNTIGFSFDMFNFTNFLNKNWGRRYNGIFYGHQLIDVVSVANNNDGTYTATYGVNPSRLNDQAINAIDNTGLQSSIWQMQFGIIYTF